MRSRLLLLIGSLLLVGCGLAIGEGPAELDRVPPGPIGPVIARPGGGGPPIECRQLAQETCGGVGSIEDGVAGVDLESVDRVIVSCIGRCTPGGGEFRIDVLIDDSTREIGRGGYGTTTP